MKLIFLVAIGLCLVLGAAADEDVEEATVVEEEPAKTGVNVEEIPYASPIPAGQVYFAEHFDDNDEFEARWVRSQAKKDGADDEIAKYDGN